MGYALLILAHTEGYHFLIFLRSKNLFVINKDLNEREWMNEIVEKQFVLKLFVMISIALPYFYFLLLRNN